jgi:hypothetical protein
MINLKFSRFNAGNNLLNGRSAQGLRKSEVNSEITNALHQEYMRYSGRACQAEHLSKTRIYAALHHFKDAQNVNF